MKDSIIKFSIIVTSYNYEQYISKTLESLANQTYKNFEVIIVDDGSKDNSVEIIEQYTKKYENFHLFQHEQGENKGMIASVKLALENASGDYIAFCESDDYLSEDYLQEKFNYISNNENTVILANAIQTIGNTSADEYVKKVTDLFNDCRNKNKYFYYMYKYNIIPTLSSVCIKASVLRQCNFDAFVPAWFDYWIYRQITLNYNIDFIYKKLTYWRIHEDSLNSGLEDVENKMLQEFLKKSNKLLFNKYPLKILTFKFLRIMGKIFNN